MNRFAFLFVLPALLCADFRYDSTSRITKGMILKMPFVKKPEPTTTSHYFKGSRSAAVDKNSTSIFDFEKQVFVVMDHQQKQYWQMTFAEMEEQMKQAGEQMKSAQQKNRNVQGEMKLDVKATGETKEVNGFQAGRFVMTMEFAAKDGQSGQSGSMKLVNDSWNTKSVPGFAEHEKFMKEMAGKMAWGRSNPFMAMMNQPGMAEGMKKLATEAAKIEGVPVLTITRMGVVGGAQPDMSQMKDENGEPVNVGDAAKEAAAQEAGSSAGRAIGGRLGGLVGGGLGGKFGGFGRKRKQEEPKEEPKEEAKAAPKAAPAPAETTADGMSILMEIVTDSSNFSSAPVGEEVFAIPAGYKQVEAPKLGKRR
ncbi:MAG: hypothetical protein OHK0021_05420 [Bryobacter sp.]